MTRKVQLKLTRKIIILILKRCFYVFFVKIERFFKILSIGILCEVPFQYFHFMDFASFRGVYMKYCMCEFIVKSKNNLKKFSSPKGPT